MSRNIHIFAHCYIAPKTAMHLLFKSAGRRMGNSRDGFKQRAYEEITDSRIYWAEDFEIEIG